MGNKLFYRYYVEGENERSLLEVLKTDFRCIEAGKIEIFNVVKERLTPFRIRMFKPNTVIVLVYDTDVNKTDVLKENILFLKKQACIKEIICIPQVNRLEDELIRSCNIRNVLEITHSKSNKEFKADFNRCTNLAKRLTDCSFDIHSIWNKTPENGFKDFGNQSSRVKL